VQGKWGDGQHAKRGGGRGTTGDKRVADNVRQAAQGNLAADDTTRGWGWRTRDDAKGSGNNYDDDDEDQSLRWQERCNNDNTYQSFVYSDEDKQQAQQVQLAMTIRGNKDTTMLGVRGAIDTVKGGVIYLFHSLMPS
jgi:hypothetical protein